MKHAVFDYYKAIERTHKGLGNLGAAALLAVKAQKAFCVSAVSGTGKTTELEWAADQSPLGVIRMDSMTRSGLTDMQDELTGYGGVLLVSDLGAADTVYSVREATKVIALLCHEHRLSKRNVSIDLEIDNYYGAALTTIQPASMGRLVTGPEWESVLADKITRYYHLLRPTQIRNEPLEVKTKWGPELESVQMPKPLRATIAKWVDNTIQPWSDSRAVQHWVDYSRAAAALAGRKTAKAIDYAAAKALLAPIRLESYLIGREHISSDRYYLADDHCILTELATYGELNHVRTVKNYRISARTLQRSIDRASTWIIPGGKGAGRHTLSAQAQDVLTECGYKVRAG